MRKWLKWTLISLAMTVALVSLALSALSYSEKRARETKSVRELTATVTGKGYRQYDMTNYKYIDKSGRYIYQNEDGDEYQRYPPDEDWLIYYEIDYFSPKDEPTSSTLMEFERQRITSGKRRVTIFSKEQYDRTNIGDKIHLNYQRFSNRKVSIW